MRKALVNYWVDMVTGVAFLFCAVTGIVRLFPEATTLTASGAPAILGVSTVLWATIHDWSGAVMAAGVGVHTVLHLRWLAHMTRRIASGDEKRTARVVPAGASRAARVPATTVAASAAADVVGVQPGAPRIVAAAEVERLERRWEDKRRENQRRHTRKAFLTGAAALGGAALLVGLGLAGRDAASGLLDRFGEQASASEVGGSSQAQLDDSGYGSSAQDSSAGTGSTGGGAAGGSTGGTTSSGTSAAGSAGSAATARVAVDSGSCAGCGACLQVCPAGVFTFSGSTAVAQNPDACRLCGRCTQVCRPGAITLSA